MGKERIVVTLYNIEKKQEYDVDIPVDITANELIIGLNRGFGLGIDTSDYSKCYMKAENPITLIRGNKIVKEYGLRNGTKLFYS